MPFYILAIPAVLIMRLIKPWLLVRTESLFYTRIGHFAGNTEIYLCQRDAGINVPNQPYIDLFYIREPICNMQLAIMWKRVLRLWPAWVLGPIYRVNQLIPGGRSHEVGLGANSRDTRNLLGRFPPHLQFTNEEETCGAAGLRALGLPIGAQFVCLNVRDSAYLDDFLPGDWAYHNYRDSNIQNYVLASEALAERGFFIIRMGAKVREAINSVHPKVIDYARNGMRSDFMDIYLGAKCAFSISTGSGWDSVPLVFRRPIAFVNLVPLGQAVTNLDNSIYITKRHVLHASQKTLTLSEIFSQGAGFCNSTSDYKSADVDLYENTPEEICAVAIEMAERLNGTWQRHAGDEPLQQRFREVFPADALCATGHPLHGEIRARFGAAFLRNNPEWLH